MTAKSGCRRSDALWGKLLHQLYPHCALGCDECSGPPQAHHLITRWLKPTRHDVRNGIVLCASHHMFSKCLSAHKAPLQFAEWMRINKPEQYEWVISNRNPPVGRTDWDSRLTSLGSLLPILERMGREWFLENMWLTDPNEWYLAMQEA